MESMQREWRYCSRLKLGEIPQKALLKKANEKRLEKNKENKERRVIEAKGTEKYKDPQC